MKKIIVVFLFAAMLTANFAIAPVCAEDSGISIRINGNTQVYDTTPVILNNRTMVPLRGIFESLSSEVSWDGETQTVTAKKEGTEIRLAIGESNALVNGKEIGLDAPAVIIDSRTMVPVRFVSEALGAIVDWDDTRKIVDIYTISKDIYGWLKKIDAMYTKDVLEWVVDVYDPETGGFYYSYSARDNEQFGPDIESTWQAISIMQGSGIIPGGNPPDNIMPKEIKDKFVSYAQSLQDPDDGYFYNKKIGKKISDSRRERDLMWAKGTITKFGGTPLYKLPAERALEAQKPSEEESIPEYLLSEEGLRKWMAALPWETNAYSAANTLIAASQSITAAGLRDVVVNYLIEIQNPETGFWGPAGGYAGLNAAMKASGYFTADTKPYPYIDKMLESLLKAINEEIPNTASALWNPLTLIITAKDSYGGKIEPALQEIIDKNIVKILEFEYNNLQRFKRNDGGYSYYENSSISTSQGAPVSLGLLEGDMNSVNLCTVKFRNDCYKVAGVTPTPFFDNYRDWLWDELLNKKPIVKNLKPASGGSFYEDFEKSELDKTPKNVISNTKSGAVKVVTDPYSKNNKVLMITSEETGVTSAAININEIGKSNNIEISFKLLMETGTPAPIYYMELGKKAFSLILNNSAGGDKFSFGYRRHDSEMGKTIENIPLDEWFDIKIEYKPKGLKDTVTNIYIDDELKCTTNEYYYGKDEGALPNDIVDYLIIAAWSNRAGTVYIDNIKINAEEIDK